MMRHICEYIHDSVLFVKSMNIKNKIQIIQLHMLMFMLMFM